MSNLDPITPGNVFESAVGVRLTPFQQRALPFFRWLSEYHRYEVLGLEHLPRSGPVLLVANHSLATYDAFLLGVHLMLTIGRFPRVLADRTIFRTPGLSRVATELGFVEGSRDAALELLKSGQIVGTAPGGMRESLRDSRDKYRVEWGSRLGFVWTAMTAKAPIVLAACPAADDIFDVVPNPVTPWVYKHFRLPLPIVHGRLGLPVPRPAKLWHLLSEPILPEAHAGEVRREDVERHHRTLVERMNELMAEAVRLRPRLRA